MTVDVRFRNAFAFVCLIAAVVLCGCSGGGSDADDVPGALSMTPAEQEAWEIRLVEMRIDKNEAYMDPAQTPLIAADLPAFEGLNYYWPEASMRFKAPFTAEAKPDTIELVKRKGDMVTYLRKGTVSFRYDDVVRTLAVFGPVDTSTYGDYVWLPFFDATTGSETYPGGRYLDLEIDVDGMVDLDFNFAYNPLCDYNHEKYNCTLPPAENRLEFAVVAGEKLFRSEE